MEVVRALPEDAAELSSVAHAAKRHWGYPEGWLRLWDDALTLTPDYIRTNATFCIRSGGHIVGFFVLVLREGEAFLDHLWVLPSEMGKGAGRRLFESAEEVARSAGAATLRVESDPHSEEFYVHMGATRCGLISAPMEGHERSLPLLEKAL
jgi:GNAT superfamily N-acetyltransferase